MSDKIESVLELLREVLQNGREIDVNVMPFINFKGDASGKGLIWTGKGNPKQFIFVDNNDRFFASETIDLAKGRSFSINNAKVLSENELGSTVTKSNLTQVGRLNGLLVDGDVSIKGQANFVQGNLGLGTPLPEAAIHIKDSAELKIGNGAINTVQEDLNLSAGSTQITLSPNGSILLGNQSQPPVQINVHGKVAVRVKNPDPEVDLHVAGSVKFGNRLQKVDRSYPTAGSYNAGDIVWNSEPRINQYVGWVCVQAGTPGLWEPFGKIGNS